MKAIINTKREKLVEFIRQQMVGPGGCNYHFGIKGLADNEEVLNTTPGSIYSTGILFPEKEIEEASANNNDVEPQPSDTFRDESDDYMSNIEDLNPGNIDGEDSFSVARRFPNAIALSCCISSEADLNKDVNITVSGRYYTKIKDDSKKNVYINLSLEDKESIESIFERFQEKEVAKLFCIDELKIRPIFNSTKAEGVYKTLQDIDQELAGCISNKVRKNEWGSHLFVNTIAEHLFLQSCRTILYRELNKKSSTRTADELDAITRLIDDVGKYEQALHILKELTELYYKTGYGFWQSHTETHKIDLSGIDFSKPKRVYTHKSIGCDALKIKITDKLSLSVRLQLTKDVRDPSNQNNFLKVLVENTSQKFKETPKDHYTIVNEKLNELCFFGIKIEVESDKLLPYRTDSSYNDPNKEEDRLKFLYRDIEDYATGNLCSVDWERCDHPRKVWTEFLPTYDLPDVEPTPRDKRDNWVEDQGDTVPPPFLMGSNALNFHRLSTFSDANNDEIRDDLSLFVSKYKEWIDKLPSDAERPEFSEYTKKECMKDYERISKNIDKILSDDNNLLSFRLMNSAMLMQIWHNDDNLKIAKETTITPDFYRDKGMEYNWRPFQLAFILLNLDGVIQREDDPKWKARNEIVDLVWFPTGGGKTESYLGIIAMTIIHRRKTYGENGYGTTAIMRYTLRMLANDQFMRALKLILALDQIRIWGSNDDNSIYHIGQSPVSIGLYVGGGSLPNKYTNINDRDPGLVQTAALWVRRDDVDSLKTNIPIDRCPWCGEKLSWGAKYLANRYKGFYCMNDSCSFHYHFPAQLCDELIYADPPTLLFGTVDKFAQIARKVSDAPETDCLLKDSRRLFGVTLDYRAPELIIQDELHLLLGPLGSAVSLFECAIDQLCTNTMPNNNMKIRPKIISSTATTRNTSIQIRALYDREVNIFPKSGVDYDDSFFSFYKRKKNNHEIEWVSKRKYLGIMPTGRTQTLTQIRLAAILLVHRAVFEKEFWEKGKNDNDFEFVANNFYSIVSYFNSLKEVGKTDAQYPYEFTKYVQRLYRRVLGYQGMMDCLYAGEDSLTKSELTGRLNGQQVVHNKNIVKKEYKIAERLPRVEGGTFVQPSTPPDYILATNMISVGIDVSRFNTIIMNSMPRNIAEYIQASSRVARSVEGLVITLHNPFAARDVSHFEKFIEFHKKMYFYVEPISITPFSPQSVEKYLPLYLGTIIRHTFDSFHNNGDAINIRNAEPKDMCKKLFEYFEQRCENTQSVENADSELKSQIHNLFTSEMKDYLKKYIEEAIEAWKDLSSGESLWYYDNGARKGRPDNFLYVGTEEYCDVKENSKWVVPQALRIVEPEAVIKIKNNY